MEETKETNEESSKLEIYQDRNPFDNCDARTPVSLIERETSEDDVSDNSQILNSILMSEASTPVETN